MDIKKTVMATAELNKDYRTGQILFNLLPKGAQSVVAGTVFDPFHKNLTPDEIAMWVHYHLVLHNGRIVMVFRNNDVLWEE